MLGPTETEFFLQWSFSQQASLPGNVPPAISHSESVTSMRLPPHTSISPIPDLSVVFNAGTNRNLDAGIMS